MKKLIFFVLLAQGAIAQQESLRMIYPFIPMGINPAVAGQRGVASITGVYRKKPLFQRGFVPSSQQQYFSFDMPISQGKGGFGFLAYNTDQTYLMPMGKLAANLGLSVVGTYVMNFGRGHELRMGGQVGVDQYPILNRSGTAVLKGSYGFGLIYRHDQLTLGLSRPIQNTSSPTYLRASYVKQLDNVWLVHVGSLLRISNEAKKVDMHASIWWNERVALGLWYQGTGSEFGDAACLISSEVALGRNFRIGYAYDLLGKQMAINTQPSSSLVPGFHQVFLRYEIDTGNGKIAEFRL
jgi:hypothetical protein